MDPRNFKESKLYKKGLEVFASKYEPSHVALLEKLYEFSPELADVVIAHGLGDIWEIKLQIYPCVKKKLLFCLH